MQGVIRLVKGRAIVAKSLNQLDQRNPRIQRKQQKRAG
jgi:hypothetical protein